MRRRHDLPFGATLVPDGVRFRLWAPAARRVELALDGGRAPMFMPPEGDGWFALTTGAACAGERYHYRVDGLDVPDPASRFQPEDVHGNSEIIDPAAHEWRDDEWRGRPWEEIVLYELHVGAFSTAGNFDGAIAHLDHVAALGATAVEIMPVGDFPGRRNWGYDGVLLFAPATAYGRPDDLKRLVEACHRRGLAVLLDVVYNHFGPEGNYLGRYAPAFFTSRHQTPWGAAINFDADDAQAVRTFYVENALYWLEEFHFDGLRFDAVHAIMDDGPQHILAEIADAVAARFARERPIHLVLENDRNEAWPLARRDGRPYRYVGQWNDDLHHALHVLATGETAGYYGDYAEAPLAQLGRALAEGFAFQGEPSPYRGGAVRGEASSHLPPTAFVAFVQNHDQVGNTPLGTRLAQVAPAERVRLVTAIALLSPQIPLLFMGEEWATECPFPFFCDFEPGLAEKVREGRRREFANFPGFHEQIPDPCAAATFESAKLDWDARAREPHRTWLDWYRKVLAVRTREIVPRLSGVPGNAGTFTTIGASGLTVTWRLGDGSRLLLHANFGTSALTLDPAPSGRLLFAQPAGDRHGDVLPPLSAVFHLDKT